MALIVLGVGMLLAYQRDKQAPQRERAGEEAVVERRIAAVQGSSEAIELKDRPDTKEVDVWRWVMDGKCKTARNTYLTPARLVSQLRYPSTDLVLVKMLHRPRVIKPQMPSGSVVIDYDPCSLRPLHKHFMTRSRRCRLCCLPPDRANTCRILTKPWKNSNTLRVKNIDASPVQRSWYQ